MKSLEDRLHELRTPDFGVESHRTHLGYRLTQPAPARVSNYRRPALVCGMLALILIGGLTAIHPSWAGELLHLVFVRERKITTQDGHKLIERTYQAQPPATGGTVHLEASSSGDITSATTQTQTDPALEAMHTEAESQIQQGQAQMFLEQDNMRFYHVTLRDGRHITYVSGPGTSWSVSTNH